MKGKHVHVFKDQKTHSPEEPKKPRRPLVLRPIPPPRRLDFCGGLVYDAARTPQDTIVQILCKCLEQSLGKPIITTQDVKDFCRQKNISPNAVVDLFGKGWLSEPKIGNDVWEILKQAGYAGNIDDLWSSLYNTVKPSKPVAYSIPKAKRKQMARRKWIHFLNSGQTLKPGSHRAPS